jgi:pyruvate,orthophosphate dikinase
MMAAGEENVVLMSFLKICDAVRRLGVRTNADTPADAAKARAFGAEGIGLCRTEHMFYGKGSDEPLFVLRKMIMSKSEQERKRAVDELFPHVKTAIKGTWKRWTGCRWSCGCSTRRHEFVPEGGRAARLAAPWHRMDEAEQAGGCPPRSNPMMGHRGVRLGVPTQ